MPVLVDPDGDPAGGRGIRADLPVLAIVVAQVEDRLKKSQDAKLKETGDKLTTNSADVEQDIVDAVNALRARYTYLFTTGGIGPTHDDITADAVGAAFGLPVEHHPEAFALLSKRYAPGEFNEMRQRMARTPKGATLIKNPVSTAPGKRTR